MSQAKHDVQDDDRPSNTLEMFVELPEVLEMISNLPNCYANTFEKSFENYSEIMSRYQEQPHLLDSHLTRLIEDLLVYIRNRDLPDALVHASFKYLYQLSKVRTYKVLVKFLPHDLLDLDFVLHFLERQSISDSENWETRYMLLLWMSILVLNPFHMSRLDAFSPTTSSNHIATMTKMERIYNICLINSAQNDTSASVAAFLCSKYLIRTDVKDAYLPLYIDWVTEQNQADTLNIKFGQLAAVAAILKHGKREDLLPHVPSLLKWMLGCNFKNNSDFLKYKYFVKIVQRLGLIFLKPRLAQWRYQRGSRSLTANLKAESDMKGVDHQNCVPAINEGDTDDNINVPEEIEDIIEELLQALRSASSNIRWLAAKGIGRVTNRLPKTMGDEIVGSVIEMLSPLEPHEAWHGACLAIAELAKRGLLLPYRLSAMVPLLLQALVYDEMKGYMSVGQHIRDAACYMSWAFARAYNPADLQPFVNRIATGLLITTIFDREINCRRAASAAFQESVGRLGNFPYGIEILTAADFYSVGLRSNSYLKISDFIAQYDEYTTALIDHLIEKKVNHWDTAIRELSAKTLHKLTKRAPEYMATNVLPLLFTMTESIDINARHGVVLAIGEIVLALATLDNAAEGSLLSSAIIKEINQLIDKYIKREVFRGMSGEIMKQCCCDFIRNVSAARVAVTDECIESWQSIIDKCIVNKQPFIREVAIAALAQLCTSYYTSRIERNTVIVSHYLSGSENDLEEHVRMGFVSAIGALPKFMLRPSLQVILTSLIRRSLVPQSQIENSITALWSEARRDSIIALSHVIHTIGFDINDAESFGNVENLNLVFTCFLSALDEYTLDNRGDIGAWVREASMAALNQLVIACPKELLNETYVHQMMSGFAQQAVEKIDRTRGMAGRLFCGLVHHSPAIPYIQRHDILQRIFPEDLSETLWLFADHTFPLFCAMLELPEYSNRLILGMSASIGQLTESLIKHSSASMFHFLKSHPLDIPRIGDEIIAVFEKNVLNERVTYPMLNFLDLILSSGTLNILLCDSNCRFADEVFRLVNLEISGHKKLYKLVSSINVYCQLIQVPRLCNKVLSKMSVFLGLTYVHIRKSTATKLYEALTLYGDTSSIPDDKLFEALTILSETDWGSSLAEVRPIRNELCALMGIKAPAIGQPK